MSEVIYSYPTLTGRELVVKRHESGTMQLAIIVGTDPTNAIHALLPDTPAERMRLAAAILAEDLPEVRLADDPRMVRSGHHHLFKDNPEIAREALLHYVALVRDIDARAAAKAEAEQRDAEQVDAEAERLYELWFAAVGATATPFEDFGQGGADAWRAVARDSLARQKGGA